MLTIGPIAYQDKQGIHWLQIIIGDNGVCTEIKQASEADFAANIWQTLDTQQWPTTFPIYDPAASQSHYLLSRSEDNKITQHRVSEVKLQQSPNAQPLYRISSQTYTGTHLGAPSLLKEQELKNKLIPAAWYPNEETQGQLKEQFQTWKQKQASIWHREEGNPKLDMPNQPLDFKTTQRGEAKAEITHTDLNKNQQWIVQSIIIDRLATLKAESTSSIEYTDALRFLIDGTEPGTPFSDTTAKNIDDVKHIISAAGINRYMKQNFYRKIIKEGEQERWADLAEADIGYAASIQSVVFYIQQLLQAEILQYFPHAVVNIPEKAPVTLLSAIRLGNLPAAQAETIEEVSNTLSREEIQQIEDISRLFTGNYPLISADDQTLSNLYSLLDSMQRRYAITERVASTIRLLIPQSDVQYEATIQAKINLLQQHRKIKNLFTNLLNEDTPETNLPHTEQNLLVLIKDLPIMVAYLNSYPQQQKYDLLIKLFQQGILSKSDIRRVINQLAITTPDIQQGLTNRVFELSAHNEIYQLYYSALTDENPIDLNMSADVVQNLADTLNRIGPRTLTEIEFLEWMDILVPVPDVWPTKTHSVRLQEKIDEYFLAKKLQDFFALDHSSQKEQALNTLIPEITDKNIKLLSRVFSNFNEEIQTDIIRTFLHYRRNDHLNFTSLFDSDLITAAVAKEVLDLPENEQHYFSLLQNISSDAVPVDAFTYEILLELQTALALTFPDGETTTNLSNLLRIAAKNPDDFKKIKELNKTISGRLLAKKITEYFAEPESTRSSEKLNLLLPKLTKELGYTQISKNTQSLNFALKLLSPAQQTQIIFHLLNNQTSISSSTYKDYLLGDFSVLTFSALFDVIKSLTPTQRQFIFKNHNIMYILNALFRKYTEEFNQESDKFLQDLPEETLDKLMPQITDDDIQKYLDKYPLQLSNLPQANTTDWAQTKKIISDIFAKTKANRSLLKKIETASSPKALKAVLIKEIVTGSFYDAENMVAIAIKRLNEHEVAIIQSLSAEEKKQYIQLKSAGELGSTVALEIDFLQKHPNGTKKLQRVKEALKHLPENLSPEDLQTELRNRNSPLAQAVFSPLPPSAPGYTFFNTKKLPPPDFAYIKEMEACLDKMDETLDARMKSGG